MPIMRCNIRWLKILALLCRMYCKNQIKQTGSKEIKNNDEIPNVKKEEDAINLDESIGVEAKSEIENDKKKLE